MAVADVRERMLVVGSEILEAKGVDGLTTRAVCEETGVTAPTLYHHFGNKDGLIEAIVGRAIEEFMARKRATAITEDPVADLRRGWENWIGFALERPKLFRLMIRSGLSDDSVTAEAYAIMRSLVERVASSNGLKRDPDSVAKVVWAASNGVLMMFLQGADKQEIEATSKVMFDALMSSLTAAK